MGIEVITKKVWDENFKETIVNIEDTLKYLHNQYITMLDFRAQYRKDYATHRIIHYLETKKKIPIITYKKLTPRKIGFQTKK